MAAAAAASARRLLLRLPDLPQLPLTPLLCRLAPHLQQTSIPVRTTAPSPAPAPSLPASAPLPSLREALFSFHPALQIRPCLDPDLGDAGEGGGAAVEVWADSVKKKRKRKMNKHKLRKLRKRLRRQT